jgi:hypothetical protein
MERSQVPATPFGPSGRSVLPRLLMCFAEYDADASGLLPFCRICSVWKAGVISLLELES